MTRNEKLLFAGVALGLSFLLFRRPAPRLAPAPAVRAFPYITASQRDGRFGPLVAEPAPTPANPEAVTTDGRWIAKNLVMATVPELANVPGAAGGRVAIHKAAKAPLEELFRQLRRRGLLHKVLSWDGSFAPRFVRGSTKTLSSHAYGTSFDINAKWNPQGRPPVALSSRGSVHEIAAVAVPLGWFWGAWFSNPDPHHFEWTGTASGRAIA